LENQKLQT